jgi:hypothetical protein
MPFQIGHTVSAEHRAKISALNRARHVSADTRTKMSISAKARPYYCPSAETRIKMADALRGRPLSIETKKKLSAAAVKRIGEKSSRWKGGKHPGPDGYIRIRIGGRRTHEHRVIMEKKLGRSLLKSEVVHHIDFDRGNNDMENLMVMDREKHVHYHRNLNQLFEHWIGA